MKDEEQAKTDAADNRREQLSLLPHDEEEAVSGKKERKPAEPVFKPYQQKQPYLLPPSVEELVPEDHPARVIDEIVSAMDLGELYRSYKGGGASSYDPEMLLKVLILAYSQKVYSSRRIARAVRENVAYMWLAGGNTPDFRTFAGFRSGRLKETIDKVFGATVGVLVESGYIKLKNYFLDGTKIEADANKYSFVWKKATEKFKARLEEQIRETIAEIDRVNAEEDATHGDADLPEFTGGRPIPSGKLREVIARLNKEVSESLAPDKAECEAAVKKLQKDALPRLEKYEKQLDLAGERNSYSKTDPDATFMGMKEDPMRNHQLKAAYNIQMGTEDQFIVGFSVHQASTDTGLLKPHLEAVEQTIGRLPEVVVADAGYGSEENYEYLEQREIPAYVKYGTFHKEKSRAWRRDPFRKENFGHDEDRDVYICPCGDELHFEREGHSRTRSGYVQTLRIYRASHCPSCPFKRHCASGDSCRSLQVNTRLERYRGQARERLDSEAGVELRKRRSVEVESVWGQIKHDRSLRRFLTRGLTKVKAEWGLLALAHNMLKVTALRAGY
jgi:transposase